MRFLTPASAGSASCARRCGCCRRKTICDYGDSLHAPYGVKSEAQIQALSLAAAEHLVSAGAKAIVVACNTATSAAIGLLRQVYPDIPVIGTEPALKPAVEKYPGGRILVMATP